MCVLQELKPLFQLVPGQRLSIWRIFWWKEKLGARCPSTCRSRHPEAVFNFSTSKCSRVIYILRICHRRRKILLCEEFCDGEKFCILHLNSVMWRKSLLCSLGRAVQPSWCCAVSYALLKHCCCFLSKLYFVAIFAILLQNSFVEIKLTFVWGKIQPQILPVEKNDKYEVCITMTFQWINYLGDRPGLVKI